MIRKQPVTPNAAALVKTTAIIHMALATGQILFAAVTFIIPQKLADNKGNDVLLLIVPIVAVSSFIIGHLLFKKLLSNIKTESPLKAKLLSYQSATLVRLALLEAPSLFAIVSFMLTGKMVYMGIAALIVLYFIYLRPGKQKIEDDLNLDYDEKTQLVNN